MSADYVLIHSTPPVLLYRDGQSEPAESGHAAPLLLALGGRSRRLGGENTRQTVLLANPNGEVLELWPVPPLRAQATVVTELDGLAERWTASIERISYGSACELTLES